NNIKALTNDRHYLEQNLDYYKKICISKKNRDCDSGASVSASTSASASVFASASVATSVSATDAITLEPYNILDKTLFHLQLVVFYVIINAGNKLINIKKYLGKICTYFNECLVLAYTEEYLKTFIISITPTMLRYFYFFPSYIHSVLSIISSNINDYEKSEFLEHIQMFQRKVTAILATSYKYSKDDTDDYDVDS
ncbi:hypothetical protein HEP_00528200, partial [Hepatocystis sp. ex Piliocolobus tephrosceles]